MNSKKIVVALGHSALGKTFPEQKEAVKNAAAAIADLIEAKYQVVITHSNGRHDTLCNDRVQPFGTKQHRSTYVYLQRNESRLYRL